MWKFIISLESSKQVCYFKKEKVDCYDCSSCLVGSFMIGNLTMTSKNIQYNRANYACHALTLKVNYKLMERKFKKGRYHEYHWEGWLCGILKIEACTVNSDCM